MIDRLRVLQSDIWACERCADDPRVETRLRQQTAIFPTQTLLLVVATAPPIGQGTDQKVAALSIHSDPRDRLRLFLERTLSTPWNQLVSNGLAVLHAVKCAIVPKERDERRHQNPPRGVVSKCVPPHFYKEFWELRPPVVLTLGMSARLATRIACGPAAPRSLTLPLKKLDGDDLLRITARDLTFSLVVSAHPSADPRRAGRDLLRAATIAGVLGTRQPAPRV